MNIDREVPSPPPPPEFSQALEAVHGNSGIPFRKCVISVDSLIDEDGGSFLPVEGELLSLDFLDSLRLQPPQHIVARRQKKKTTKVLRDFLPKTAYVRAEMRTMFPKLVEEYDAEKGEVKRILVGSPGIGKSVLFFLAALGRARTYEEEIVMYFRKVEDELSVFVMEAGARKGEVNVLVSRNLSMRQFSNLNRTSLVMTGPTELEEDYFFFMLDGPHHDDDSEEDLMNNSYHALCTSGGFPVPHQESLLARTILVLSGWTEPAILSALAKLNVNESDAEEAYELCGGRIRLALMAVENRRSEVTGWFDSLVTDLGADTIELAIRQQGSAGALERSDRLRTRFFYDDGSNSMLVDSRYLFQQLKARLQAADFMNAYNLAHACKLDSARGWFYEEILHRWFQGKAQDPNSVPKIVGFLRKEGITGAASVKELAALCMRNEGDGVYWVSSVPNFASIDAAILLGTVLICTQDTVKPNHSFDRDTFWTGFVGQLVEKGVVITAVHVCFLTPSDIDFVNDHHDYIHRCKLPATRAAASSSPALDIQVCFHVCTVDAGSAAALEYGASALPFLV